MINLLPPEYKEQVAYSRYNKHLLNYMLLFIFLAAAMSAILFVGVFRAEDELSSLNEVIEQRESSINEFEGTQAEAQAIESKLEKIDALYEQQSYYSNFLDELGSAFPPWAEISTIAMTRGDDVSGGDASNEDAKRLSLQLVVNSRNQVTELRDILLEMERVEFVDIQNFSANTSEDGSESEEDGISATFVLALSQPPYDPLEKEEQE